MTHVALLDSSFYEDIDVATLNQAGSDLDPSGLSSRPVPGSSSATPVPAGSGSPTPVQPPTGTGGTAPVEQDAGMGSTALVQPGEGEEEVTNPPKKKGR